MSRPRLVVVPALGTSVASLWATCAALLAPDLDVVGWDLPGHGGDRWAPSPDLTMEDLAHRLLEEVDGSFHVAGDSVGGAIGLQLMLLAPDRVRSAVLLCTGARVGTPGLWQERIEQVRASGTPSLVTASAGRWFGTGFVAREPGLASGLLHALSDTDDAAYAAVCGALAGFDVRDRLGEVRAPVLAVAGAEDVATPPSLLEEVAACVPDGRLVVLPGVGHLAPAEAPEAVADLVRAHVLQHEDPRTPRSTG